MPLLLETQALTKTYAGVQPVHALRQVDLQVQQAEFLSIVGPSGSGKSTLMQLLGLLDTPTSGTLCYMGQNTAEWSETKKSRFRNAEIGFIFQAHLLLPELTAVENLLVPVRVNREITDEHLYRAQNLLERIGLGDRMHHLPQELSGGQNQRVAIARALMNRPKIVFADEPTGALDSTTSNAVYELMRELNQQDETTFVIVTHEMAFAAKTDRMIKILDGEIVEDMDQRQVNLMT